MGGLCKTPDKFGYRGNDECTGSRKFGTESVRQKKMEKEMNEGSGKFKRE